MTLRARAEQLDDQLTHEFLTMDRAVRVAYLERHLRAVVEDVLTQLADWHYVIAEKEDVEHFAQAIRDQPVKNS